MYSREDLATRDFDSTISKRLRPLIRPGGEIYDPEWDWYCIRENEIFDKCWAISKGGSDEGNV